MEPKNNYRLVLTAPIKSDYIYNTDKIEKAGKKVMSFLSKKYNINQSLITLQDIDSNKEYSFMANIKSKHNNMYGGADETNVDAIDNSTLPKTDFLKKISEISNTINESVNSLQTAVENKGKKDNENNIIFIAKNGVKELTSINNQLDLINKKIDVISGNANKLISNKINISNKQTENKQTEQIEKNDINDINNNLLEPSLGSRTPDENLCIIM